MLARLFTIVLAVTYALALAANRPPSPAGTDAAFGVLVVGGIALAFWAGRRHSAEATATAVAAAISRSAAYAAARSSSSVTVNLGPTAPTDPPPVFDTIALCEAYDDPAPTVTDDPALAADLLYEATGQRFDPDVALDIVQELNDDSRSHLLGLREGTR